MYPALEVNTTAFQSTILLTTYTVILPEQHLSYFYTGIGECKPELGRGIVVYKFFLSIVSELYVFFSNTKTQVRSPSTIFINRDDLKRNSVKAHYLELSEHTVFNLTLQESVTKKRCHLLLGFQTTAFISGYPLININIIATGKRACLGMISRDAMSSTKRQFNLSSP